MLCKYYFTNSGINFQFYTYNPCVSSKCIGEGAVYRISFCLFVFYILHYFFMFAKKSIEVHQGYWVCKLLMLFLLIFVSYFIPNSVFDVYAQFSRVVSGFFLLAQVLILIDLAWALHEMIRPSSDEEEGGACALWKIAILGGSCLGFAFSLTIFIFSLQWFAPSGCTQYTRNQTLISLTFVLTFIAVFLQLFVSKASGANLLTSAIVVMYSYFLMWSGLSSDGSNCNTLNSSTSETWNVVVGIIIAAASVTFAGYSLANSENIFGISNPEQAEEVELAEKKIAESEHKEDVESGAVKSDAEEESAIEFKLRVLNRRFHFVMAACAVYLAMVLTSWDVPNSSETSVNTSSNGDVSLWVKFVCEWVSLLLYIWTLIAPNVCPDYEFHN